MGSHKHFMAFNGGNPVPSAVSTQNSHSSGMATTSLVETSHVVPLSLLSGSHENVSSPSKSLPASKKQTRRSFTKNKNNIDSSSTHQASCCFLGLAPMAALLSRRLRSQAIFTASRDAVVVHAFGGVGSLASLLPQGVEAEGTVKGAVHRTLKASGVLGALPHKSAGKPASRCCAAAPPWGWRRGASRSSAIASRMRTPTPEHRCRTLRPSASRVGSHAFPTLDLEGLQS